MRLINSKRCTLTVLFILTLFAHSIQAASLIVEVSGINDLEGIVHVGLYDKMAGFPDEHEYMQGRTVSAADCIDGKTTVSFESLLPGEYAVAGYHDINNNDELDTNLVGIPQEPYGASLGARNMLSPPDYDDAKFKLDTQDMKISVEFQ